MESFKVISKKRTCPGVRLAPVSPMCVCVWQRYSPNGWMDFDESFHKWSDRYLWGPFFLRFWNFQTMTSWRPFLRFFVPSISHKSFYLSKTHHQSLFYITRPSIWYQTRIDSDKSILHPIWLLVTFRLS